MNQESTFEVLDEKAVANWTRKSYHEVRNEVLRVKNSYLAIALHNRFKEMEENDKSFDRDEAIQRICDKAAITEAEFDEIMAGDVDDVSADFIIAVSTVLNFDVNDRKKVESKKQLSEVLNISETKSEHENSENMDGGSSAVDNASVSNPMMDQAKAQTTLLAQLNGHFEALISEIRGLRTDLATEKQATETQTDQGEPDETMSSQELDERAARIAKFEEEIFEIAKKLN